MLQDHLHQYSIPRYTTPRTGSRSFSAPAEFFAATKTSRTHRKTQSEQEPSSITVIPGAKLRGRVAFVTGGTRGIGAAISRSLAAQGATVAAGFGRNTDQAAQFLDVLERDAQHGARMSVHQGDISDPAACRRTIDEVIERHGRLDILINNAGITIDRTVPKMTDDDWNDVISVNLSGTFFMAQAAMKHMLPRGTGRIVNVSARPAISARRTTPHRRPACSASPKRSPVRRRSIWSGQANSTTAVSA